MADYGSRFARIPTSQNRDMGHPILWLNLDVGHPPLKCIGAIFCMGHPPVSFFRPCAIF
jgi:hypothetical protein